MSTSAGVYHYGCLWTDFMIKVRSVYRGLVEARSAVSDGYVWLLRYHWRVHSIAVIRRRQFWWWWWWCSKHRKPAATSVPVKIGLQIGTLQNHKHRWKFTPGNIKWAIKRPLVAFIGSWTPSIGSVYVQANATRPAARKGGQPINDLASIIISVILGK